MPLASDRFVFQKVYIERDACAVTVRGRCQAMLTDVKTMTMVRFLVIYVL